MQQQHDYDDLASIIRISNDLSWSYPKEWNDMEDTALSMFNHCTFTLVVMVISKRIPALHHSRWKDLISVFVTFLYCYASFRKPYLVHEKFVLDVVRHHHPAF
jgi:hypothetical protein